MMSTWMPRDAQHALRLFLCRINFVKSHTGHGSPIRIPFLIVPNCCFNLFYTGDVTENALGLNEKCRIYTANGQKRVKASTMLVRSLSVPQNYFSQAQDPEDWANPDCPAILSSTVCDGDRVCPVAHAEQQGRYVG